MIPKNIETDYLIVKQQLDSFNRNKVVLWNKENDALPLNLTLNTSILDDSFKLKFHSFINKLKQNDDDLYWYEKERWHMTILGLIPTTDSLNETP